MTLKEQLKSDLKDAMRAKEIVKRDAIRAINTMIKQIEVDERKELNDNDIVLLIQKGVKQRQDAILQFQEASRDDLIAIEQEQIDIFSLYLPTQLTTDELEEIISKIIHDTNATSMKDMGKVMSAAKELIGVKSDGKNINQVVKKLLG
jgi:uncharacterized protein YqeY